MSRTFLGKSLKFPIVGKFESEQGVHTVLQDIQLLLLTKIGERPMRPTFGCLLPTRIWQNLDDVAIKGTSDISVAINTFEPRVKLIEVIPSVNYVTGLVFFNIRFVIIDLNQEANLIFPFKPVSQLS